MKRLFVNRRLKHASDTVFGRKSIHQSLEKETKNNQLIKAMDELAENCRNNLMNGNIPASYILVCLSYPDINARETKRQRQILGFKTDSTS